MPRRQIIKAIDGLTYSGQLMSGWSGSAVSRVLTMRLGPKGLAAIVLEHDDLMTRRTRAGDEKPLEHDPKEEKARQARVDAERTRVARCAALAGAVLQASEAEDLNIIRTLLEGFVCDKVDMGGDGNVVEAPVLAHFDDHFAGRYAHLGKVLWWILRENFLGPT